MLRTICLALLGIAIAFVIVAEMGLFARRYPVLDAAEEGDITNVTKLLKAGHSIDEVAKTKFGWTPLMAAIYQGNTGVVHYLISAGANVNIHDNTGDTALMWATLQGDQNLAIVKELITHGADVTATNQMGASVLAYASSDPPKPAILQAIKAAIEQRNDRTRNTNGALATPRANAAQ
jgi:ankyrin repeat protein